MEWKLGAYHDETGPHSALETSLVEWKQPQNGVATAKYAGLGNFLSGMETGAGETPGGGSVGLGNFLSGMETALASFHFRQTVEPWKLP